jgi:hypothetical protein
LTVMAGNRHRINGAHTHPDQFSAVDRSKEISAQLKPVVDSLNAIVDRLEQLAGMEDEGEKDGRPEP